MSIREVQERLMDYGANVPDNALNIRDYPARLIQKLAKLSLDLSEMNYNPSPEKLGMDVAEMVSSLLCLANRVGEQGIDIQQCLDALLEKHKPSERMSFGYRRPIDKEE